MVEKTKTDQEKQFIFARGLPASGKSSWAKKWVEQDPENRVRIGRDDIRMALSGQWAIADAHGNSDKDFEAKVTAIENNLIAKALKSGKSVVSDNTHLTNRGAQTYMSIAKQHDAKVYIKEFPISVKEAMRRDTARNRTVGAKVIYRMAKNIGPNGEFHHIDGLHTPQPFKKPETRKAGIIFDMDGTLVDIRPIRHYVRPENGEHRRFDMFHRSSLFCAPNKEVLEMLQDAQKKDIPIIIVSARQERYREVSDLWLKRNGIKFDNMYLRPNSDSRPDYDVKKDILKKVQRDYDILRAVDDNPAVRDVWVENNIETTIVPGFDDPLRTDMSQPLKIDNVFRTGGCIRCGKPLKSGALIGPRCAKFN